MTYTEDSGESGPPPCHTCGFIDAAKKESIEEILKLAAIRRRETRSLSSSLSCKRLCDELKEEIPEIDVLYGVGDDDKIVEYCSSVLQVSVSAETDIRLADTAYAYLKIAEGCDRGCSYCVIQIFRGSYKSRMLRRS